MPGWLTLRNTGIATGFIIIWSQLLLWGLGVRTPSDTLLALGLGMLYPSARAHVKTILSASEPEAGSSSSQSPPPSPPSSSPSSSPGEAAGE